VSFNNNKGGVYNEGDNIRDFSLEAWALEPESLFGGYEFLLQAERDKSRIPRQTFETRIVSITAQ
jgi:hypothetical protein